MYLPQHLCIYPSTSTSNAWEAVSASQATIKASERNRAKALHRFHSDSELSSSSGEDKEEDWDQKHDFEDADFDGYADDDDGESSVGSLVLPEPELMAEPDLPIPLLDVLERTAVGAKETARQPYRGDSKSSVKRRLRKTLKDANAGAGNAFDLRERFGVTGVDEAVFTARSTLSSACGPRPRSGRVPTASTRL